MRQTPEVTLNMFTVDVKDYNTPIWSAERILRYILTPDERRHDVTFPVITASTDWWILRRVILKWLLPSSAQRDYDSMAVALVISSAISTNVHYDHSESASLTNYVNIKDVCISLSALTKGEPSWTKQSVNIHKSGETARHLETKTQTRVALNLKLCFLSDLVSKSTDNVSAEGRRSVRKRSQEESVWLVRTLEVEIIKFLSLSFSCFFEFPLPL